MTKEAPVRTYRAGGVSAAVWRNESEKDGRTVVAYSVRFQKRFRKNDEWQNSDYYFPEDLPKLQLVAAKAFEFVSLKDRVGGGFTAPASHTTGHTVPYHGGSF